MIFYGRRISHCGYTMFSLSIPLSGHLDCSHDLAIVNSTTVNTGVRVPFQINALFLGDPLLWPLDLIHHHSVQRSTGVSLQYLCPTKSLDVVSKFVFLFTEPKSPGLQAWSLWV